MLFDLRAQARTFQAVATFHRLCYAFEHEGVWSIPRRCSLIMRSHNMQRRDKSTFKECGDAVLGEPDKPLAQAFPAAAAQINAHFGGF